MNAYIPTHTRTHKKICICVCNSAWHSHSSTALHLNVYQHSNLPYLLHPHPHQHLQIHTHTREELHFQNVATALPGLLHLSSGSLPSFFRQLFTSAVCLIAFVSHFFLFTTHMHTFLFYCTQFRVIVFVYSHFLLFLIFCEITPWSSGGSRERAQCCQRNCAQFISPCLAPQPLRHQVRIHRDICMYDICMHWSRLAPWVLVCTLLIVDVVRLQQRHCYAVLATVSFWFFLLLFLYFAFGFVYCCCSSVRGCMKYALISVSASR